MLNQEEIDQFTGQGYLHYGPLLPLAEVEELRGEYDAVFRQAVEDDAFRNIAVSGGAAQQQLAAPRQVFQIMQLCERSIRFRRLLYDRRILDIVEDLLGPNIMLFHDQALFKPPRHGAAVHWHQDNGYWRCRPAHLISCWITLDHADRDNGAMQVIPGSHLRPVGHSKSRESEALLQTDGVEVGQAKVLELPAGGAMFHHCQTLHYTAPNLTDRPRRAFAIHFMPPGTRDRDGKVIPVEYGHPMLRMRI